MGHLESMYCDVVEPSLHNGDRRGIGPVSIGAAVRLWEYVLLLVIFGQYFVP